MAMADTKEKLTIYLAPMQGLTDSYFRTAIHNCPFGNSFDMAVSPFISITHGDLSCAHKKIKDVSDNTNSIPLIPQIMGNEPKEFIDLANLLYDCGYSRIDWNLGCPLPKVAKKHHGSGLLPYPLEVEKILSIVIPKIRPRLSIKMRTGYSKAEYQPLISIFNQYPLAGITIHPRLGIQMYDGAIDYEAPKVIAQTSLHPVTYNGDINSLEDYRKVQKLYPAISSYMLGRGAIANPLLATEIKANAHLPESTAAEWYLEYVDKLLSAIQQLDKPDASKANKTKEYFRYIARHLSLTDAELMPILKCNNLLDIHDMIRRIVSENISTPSRMHLTNPSEI